MIRSAALTAGLKAGAILIAFAASLLYARALGPHGYGQYAYVIAWTTLLTVIAGLGLPQYLIREGAKAPQSLRWLLAWADARVLAVGTIIAALMACTLLLPLSVDIRWLFAIAAPLPLLNSLASVRSALLQAQGLVARGQWPQIFLAPAVTLLTLTMLWMWRGILHPTELVAATTGATLISPIINTIQLNKITKPHDSHPALVTMRGALPFMWLGGLYLLNTQADVIMLGSINGATDAGIYAVASRIGLLTTFFSFAANSTLAPRIAKYYYAGEHTLLQRMISGASRRYLLMTFPFAILMTIAARPLVTQLYGGDYNQSVIPLQILVASYLIQISFGSANTILNMTGHEKYSAATLSMSICLNIMLNFALIPHYGATGASIATGVSLVTVQILQWRKVRTHLNLNSATINFPKKETHKKVT